jgi:hypothetical protein
VHPPLLSFSLTRVSQLGDVQLRLARLQCMLHHYLHGGDAMPASCYGGPTAGTRGPSVASSHLQPASPVGPPSVALSSVSLDSDSVLDCEALGVDTVPSGNVPQGRQAHRVVENPWELRPRLVRRHGGWV